MALYEIDMLGSCVELPATSGATSGQKNEPIDTDIDRLTGSPEVKFNPNTYKNHKNISYGGEGNNFRNFRKSVQNRYEDTYRKLKKLPKFITICNCEGSV